MNIFDNNTIIIIAYTLGNFKYSLHDEISLKINFFATSFKIYQAFIEFSQINFTREFDSFKSRFKCKSLK